MDTIYFIYAIPVLFALYVLIRINKRGKEIDNIKNNIDALLKKLGK